MSRDHLKISHVTIIQAMQRGESQWVKKPNRLYSYTLGIGSTCTDILHLSHWSKQWDINIFTYVLVENKEFSPHCGNVVNMAYRLTDTPNDLIATKLLHKYLIVVIMCLQSFHVTITMWCLKTEEIIEENSLKKYFLKNFCSWHLF